MADIATAFLRLRADGSGFREEADATVRKSTSGLKAKVPLAVDDKSATASLDRMKARLADLRGKVTTVTLDANDKAARVRLAKLAVSLNDLGRKVISPEIDIDGVTKAEAQLLALTHQFGKLRDKAAGAAVAETASSLAGLAGSAASSVASVGASAAAIGSLVLVAAAAVVALAPLIAALAVTAAGFAGFAAIAVPMIGKVITARTALSKAEAQYDAATTKAQRAAALKAEAAATAGLTGAQKALLGPMGQIAGQWHKLTAAVQPQVTIAFGQALRIIKDLMPALTPLVKAAGKALDGLLKSMANWLESPSGKKFLAWLEVQGPKDIKAFGKFLWGLAQAAGRTFDFMVNASHTWQKNFGTAVGAIKGAAADFRNWLWRDFVQKISNFFTNTIPAAAALLRDKVHLIWDEMLIHVLKFTLGVTTTFGHLPGPLGAPFRKASAAIRTELGHMSDDVKRTVAKINGDIAALTGKTVFVQFKFPPGTIGRLHALHPGGYAGGTAGAAPGWAWTGERGPELVRFRGGEQVLTAEQSRRLAGYASGTLAGFRDRVPPPSSIDRVGAALQAVINRAVAGIQRMFGSIPAPAGFGGGGSVGPGVAAAQAFARSIMGLHGWGPGQWPALQALWNRESGWRWNALNAASGAYGIPQALPAGKMAAAGPDWRTNPATQIRWGEGYVGGRYGSPAAAWGHELAVGWYHDGGPIMEPIRGVGLSGRRYGFEAGEWVSPRRGGRRSDEAELLDEACGLLDVAVQLLAAGPRATGAALGQALDGVARRSAARAYYATR